MQLQLDFKGKREHTISFKVDDGLKNMLTSVSQDLNTPISELVRDWVNEYTYICILWYT